MGCGSVGRLLSEKLKSCPPIWMCLGGWRDLWFKMVSKWAFGAALPGQSEDVALLEQPLPKTMALELKHTWWGIVPLSCLYREGDTGVTVAVW